MKVTKLYLSVMENKIKVKLQYASHTVAIFIAVRNQCNHETGINIILNTVLFPDVICLMNSSPISTLASYLHLP